MPYVLASTEVRSSSNLFSCLASAHPFSWQIVFFLALSSAALSSLLGLLELPLRPLIDCGLFGDSRTAAIVVVAVGFVCFGLPSALSLDFLVNQDTVWGLGLILSGLFFAILVIRYGVRRFREDLVNMSSSADPSAPLTDWKIGVWWEYILKFLIPLQVAALLGWWVIYTPLASGDPHWWNPFKSTSIATVIFQWALTALCCIGINGFILHKERLVPRLPQSVRPYFERALFQTQLSEEPMEGVESPSTTEALPSDSTTVPLDSQDHESSHNQKLISEADLKISDDDELT